jgi:glycosyltransferase involved in cell wall biosynthesis
VTGGEQRRLKVLWFSTTPSLAGAALGSPTAGGGWIRSLEEEVRDHVDLSVAFYHDEDRPPFRQDSTTYHPIPRPRSSFSGRAVRRLTDALESDADVMRLMDVVGAVRPDVIHVHGTEGPFGLVQRHTEIPVLLSVQALLTVYDLKYFSGLDRRTADRSAGLSERLVRNSYADRHRRFAKQAGREREILLMTRRLTGRTDWDRRVTSVLAPDATYDVVHEILRPAFYDQVWRQPGNADLRLLTTTGPNLYKGLETLLRCARLLDERGVRYRWNVAGLAPGDPFVTLFERALSTPLSPNVHLLGVLDDDALAEQMLASDLYVGVSHIENSPNSLCEAQLVGMPCVSTYAGGTSSLVTDGQDGILVQDGDPYAMAGAVLELASDPDHAAELGARARVRASARHDRTAVTESVLRIYHELVSRG